MSQNGEAQTVVLRVGMYCDACRRKVRDAVFPLKGVEDVNIDLCSQKVTVKGILDPELILKRIRKTGKSAEILEIVLLPKPEERPEDATAKPPDPPKIITITLHVMMHCDHCTKKVTKAILKIPGVQKVDVDFEAQQVCVTGAIDPIFILMEALKTGKHTELVPPPEEEKEKDKKEDAKEEKEGEAKEDNKEEVKEEKKR